MVRSTIRGLQFGLLLAASLHVCSAQIPFLTPSSATATVVKLQGSVSALRDSYPWALNTGSTIQPQQMVVTGIDGYVQFQVSDGSTFEVFPNSKVIFRANTGNFKDLVDMVIGRIRVHIEKIGGQPNPNSVKTPTAVISVRGTIFDVIVDPEDESTTIAVTEGLVAVRHTLLPNGNDKLVSGGEVLKVYRNQPLAQNRIDRGAILDRIQRGLTDALMTIMKQPRAGGGGGSAGGGPGLAGDTKRNPPPPAPPPGPPVN
ncbi:MAG: FecR domain-containing protein [Candidatus Solibacter usitatus]|nr:FecR domain-containing protein [Candidatus Solibacter usitatus]